MVELTYLEAGLFLVAAVVSGHYVEKVARAIKYDLTYHPCSVNKCKHSLSDSSLFRCYTCWKDFCREHILIRPNRSPICVLCYESFEKPETDP